MAARLILACSMPGRIRSPAYCAAPVTLPSVSTRLTLVPTIVMPCPPYIGRWRWPLSCDVLRSCTKLTRGGADGLDNPGVAGATANVSGEAEADFVLGRIGVLVEQRLGHDDDARRA